VGVSGILERKTIGLMRTGIGHPIADLQTAQIRGDRI
jgi:hypothetical protein